MSCHSNSSCQQQERLPYAMSPTIRASHFTQSQVTFSYLDVKSFKNNIICTICPKARQARLPFSSSSIKSTVPF